MSKNVEKTPAEQVKQAEPAETPEAVEEQTVQGGSEPAAEAAAQQAEQPDELTEPQGDPAPEAPEQPKIMVTAPQGLNLREGPHVSYAAKAVLPDGDVVEILDFPKDVEVPGWALVETDAGIGWVNINFLKEMDP